MSRLFVASSSHKLKSTTPILTAPAPLTAMAWVYCTTTGFYDITGVYGSGGAADKGYRLTLDSTKFRFTWNFSGFRFADTATGVNTGQWYHVCGWAAAANDRRCYKDGVSGDQETASANDGTEAATLIGARNDDASFFDGRIAHVCWWDVALTAEEIAALARGVHPRRVRPGDCVGYWPILGTSSPEPDFSGNGNAMTLTGSPAVADGPPVEPLVIGWVPDVGGAAAGGQDRNMASNLEATADLTADAKVDRGMASSMQALAEASIALGVDRQLAAALDATADLSSVLSVDRFMASALDATADFAAALTIQGQVLYEASMAVTADFTAALSVDRQVAASCAVTADLGAALDRQPGLASAVDVTADLTASADIDRGVAAAVAASADLTAHVIRDVPLIVAMAADATLAAALTVSGEVTFVEGIEEVWRVPAGGRTFNVPAGGKVWNVS